jgi:hypothetical protein
MENLAVYLGYGTSRATVAEKSGAAGLSSVSLHGSSSVLVTVRRFQTLRSFFWQYNSIQLPLVTGFDAKNHVSVQVQGKVITFKLSVHAVARNPGHRGYMIEDD